MLTDRLSRIRISRWMGILAATSLTLILTFAWEGGRMLVVDAPERADVIVALAGETHWRPERALQLLDQGYGRLVVIDVPAAAQIYEFSQVQLAERYAQDLPEAGAIRICPSKGLSTQEESHDAERCLAGIDSHRVLIVTSDFHTRRALSIFRHELRGKSFSIAATHDDAEFGVRWWTRREWAKTFLNEWVRLVWWNAVDRWR